MSFGFGFGLPSQLYLIGSPTLNLNLAGATVLDPIVTFTRASSARYYNSLGLLSTATTNTPRFDYNPATLAAQGLLIEEQRTNLLTYSSEFDNAAWTKTGSTVSANIITSVDGAVNAKFLIVDNGVSFGSGFTRQNIAKAASATTYTSSVYAKAGGFNQIRVLCRDSATSANSSSVTVSLVDGSVIVAATATGTFTNASSSVTAVNNGWYRISLTFTSGTETVIWGGSYVPYDSVATQGNGTSGIYIYGAQLEAGAFPTSYIPSTNTFTSRASTGSFFDATGTLQSAAINVARNTYNPANLNASPFLLLEEARTNSIRNSTMVGAIAGTPGTAPTNWVIAPSGAGITRTIVGVGVENGIAYADFRYVGTPSSGNNFAVSFEGINTVAASIGQTWTNSVYVALVDGSLSGVSLTLTILETDGATGLINNTKNITPTAGILSNQRESLTATLSNAATTNIQPRIRVGYTIGVPFDITLRIGLPQLEQGAYATSVIPTTTTALTRSADVSSSAQATRAADLAPINTLSPWYNASEGTFYSEVAFISPLAFNSFGRAFEISDTTINNRMTVLGSSSLNAMRFAVVDGNVLQASLSDAAVPLVANTVYKTSAGYKLNDFGFSVNGNSASTDTSGTIPTVTMLYIGTRFDGTTDFINGWIRRITYYPRRLSNTELQSLTT